MEQQQELLTQRDTLREALRTAQKAAQDDPENAAAQRAAVAAGQAMGRFLAGPGAMLPGAPRRGTAPAAAAAEVLTLEEQAARDLERQAFEAALGAEELEAEPAKGASPKGGKTAAERMAWVRRFKGGGGQAQGGGQQGGKGAAAKGLLATRGVP